jgi:outer membrane lipoprotein carrier protein
MVKPSVKFLFILSASIITLLHSAWAADSGDASAGLKQKLAVLTSFSAQFKQTVRDEKNQVIQEASGQILMSRPDKLRWQTDAPDETLLIADGKSVWHLDYFVEQVTILSQDNVIENNPMVLLTSSDDKVWKSFAITPYAEGEQQGYRVKPLSGQGQIQQLFIYFDKEMLSSLVMKDSQGQTSRIVFSAQQLAPKIEVGAFSVTVPDNFMVDDQRT